MQTSVSITLQDWGCITDPFTSYYGQLPLADIISWRQFGFSLFSKNLRNFLGSTDVADSIAQTLGERSELFWYFNNGATILCEKIEKFGPYSLSESRKEGNFKCTGVSVVNGAQTIGTIWNQPGLGAGLDPRAKIHLRLISLENAPQDLAQQVTRATNTQKNILARDFATLDAEQRRLARDFKMDGRSYVYRQGDKPPPHDQGCTIEEVATALACMKSVEFATIAYRNAGFLTDPENAVYKEIFGTPGKPGADEAWFWVRILRHSDFCVLMLRESAQTPKHRQVATHGGRYIQHRVMNDSTVKRLRGSSQLKDEEIHASVSSAVKKHFPLVYAYICSKHDGEYLQVVFKNTQKIKAMDAVLNGQKAQVADPQLVLFNYNF